MNKLIEELDKEISRNENELERLRNAKRALVGAFRKERNVAKDDLKALLTKKKRKKPRPYRQWTDLETKQLMRMYGKLKVLPFRKRVKEISDTMDINKQRVSQKIYSLKREGRL